MIKRSALDSAGYAAFVRDRNRALEILLQKTLLKNSDTLRGALTRVLEVVAHRYPMVATNFFFTNPATSALKSIEQGLDQVFHDAALQMTHDIMVLRRRAYLMTKAAEVEALSRVTGKKYKTHINRAQLDAIASKPLFGGEDTFTRMSLALNRIKRDIIDALELSKTMEEPVDAALERVRQTFPRSREYKRFPKELKEAEKKPEVDASDLFLDEQEWEDMVEDYMNKYIPKWRDPSVSGEKIEEGKYEGLYDWEGEQQVTQDFVDKVRSGEHEAAKENGITDFIHIAIVDDKTDECCLWRDGLTISEIEAKMDEHPDDECDGTVPPLHFNCRCRIAPFSEDIPEAPPSNIGDFEEWLLAK